MASMGGAESRREGPAGVRRPCDRSAPARGVPRTAALPGRRTAASRATRQIEGNDMKLSTWVLGISMLAGVSLAHGQEAQYHPPLSADMVERSEARLNGVPGARPKDYNYHGALDLVGNGGFEFFNGPGTVRQYFERLENDSTTWTSGSIRIMLFMTEAPIVPGQGFSYWIVSSQQLSPLPPLNYYSNYDQTVPFTPPPDGIYYIYLGAFEYENNCGSTSGYCLDDYYTFSGQVQVSGGGVYNYAPPSATTTAVEYFHAGFGHYFTTAQSDEITGIDGGAYGGAWQRTGQTFKVWTSGAGLYDVCRFFQVYFAPKSSHFYTPLDYECAGLIATSFVWQYEKIAYKVKLPSAGVCPAGTIALYRLYNNGMSGAPNHRYTTSLTIRNQMIAAGWTPEDSNTACVPT